jgi:hypothetical protein
MKCGRYLLREGLTPSGRREGRTPSEGRIMVVDYTVKGDSFHALKSRLWTDKQTGAIAGGALDLRQGANGISRLFDLTPDGRRIIARVRKNSGGAYRNLGSE